MVGEEHLACGRTSAGTSLQRILEGRRQLRDPESNKTSPGTKFRTGRAPNMILIHLASFKELALCERLCPYDFPIGPTSHLTDHMAIPSMFSERARSVGQQAILGLLRAVWEHQSSWVMVVVAWARMFKGGSMRTRPTHLVIGFIARNASVLLLDPPQLSPSH